MTTLRRFATYQQDLGQAIWPKFEFSTEWMSASAALYAQLDCLVSTHIVIGWLFVYMLVSVFFALRHGFNLFF